jgi:hypothetical protein
MFDSVGIEQSESAIAPFAFYSAFMLPKALKHVQLDLVGSSLGSPASYPNAISAVWQGTDWRG